MISFEIGDPVFLNVHLGSGVSGRFPRAIIKSVNGTLLATVDLQDEGDGSYFSQAYSFPNQKIIHVAYKIYSDAGRTILSEDDQDGFDIFVQKEVSEALVRNDAIVGVFVQEEQITGVIEEDVVVGTVENDSAIEGVLSSSQISGKLTSGGEIVGQISRC